MKMNCAAEGHAKQLGEIAPGQAINAAATVANLIPGGQIVAGILKVVGFAAGFMMKGHVIRPKFYADFTITPQGVTLLKAYNDEGKGKNVMVEPGLQLSQNLLYIIKEYGGSIVGGSLIMGYDYQAKYNSIGFRVGQRMIDEDLREFGFEVKKDADDILYYLYRCFLLLVIRGKVAMPVQYKSVLENLTEKDLGGGQAAVRMKTIQALMKPELDAAIVEIKKPKPVTLNPRQTGMNIPNRNTFTGKPVPKNQIQISNEIRIATNRLTEKYTKIYNDQIRAKVNTVISALNSIKSTVPVNQTGNAAGNTNTGTGTNQTPPMGTGTGTGTGAGGTSSPSPTPTLPPVLNPGTTREFSPGMILTAVSIGLMLLGK